MSHGPAFSIALAAALGALSAPANAQGFDCSKARYQAERAVCEHPILAELDVSLNQLFDALPYDVRNGSRVKNARARFFDERDGCGYDTKCVADAYHRFIAVLRDS